MSEQGAAPEGGAFIDVNGQRAALPSPPTVAGLLASLGAHAGVAVALNAQVIPRSAWGQTPLRSGDHVEIIRAVQGG